MSKSATLTFSIRTVSTAHDMNTENRCVIYTISKKYSHHRFAQEEYSRTLRIGAQYSGTVDIRVISRKLMLFRKKYWKYKARKHVLQNKGALKGYH